MKVFVGILYTPHKSLAKLRRCIRSVENQAQKPFNFDLKIIVNASKQNDIRPIEKKLRKAGFDQEVIWTKGTGLAARGHNSVLETFLDRKSEGYTHMMKIDYDDFYYPSAFSLLHSILEHNSELDFLNLCHLSDNLLPFHGDVEQLKLHQMLPVEEISPGAVLRSPFELRMDSPELHPYYKKPYYYWNGIDCPGGEITLIKSLRAVELMQSKGYAYLEIPKVSDDYTYMMYAILEHMRGNLNFANTDCNAIYCYDMTGETSTTRDGEFTLDTSRWPEAARKAIANPEFRPLHGVARHNLPFVSIEEEIFDRQMKIEFLRKNLIGIH